MIKTQLQNAPGELVEVCDEVKCIHESLLSCDEGEKHETWFKCCVVMSVLMPKNVDYMQWHKHGYVEGDFNQNSVSNAESKWAGHKSKYHTLCTDKI